MSPYVDVVVDDSRNIPCTALRVFKCRATVRHTHMIDMIGVYPQPPESALSHVGKSEGGTDMCGVSVGWKHIAYYLVNYGWRSR